MGTENIALTEAVYYILLSLSSDPRHGYGIMQNVESLSKGRVHLAAGTLYGAINTMIEKGWICAVGEHTGRKKEYVITASGYNVLQGELERLRELVSNGEDIIGGGQK